MFRGCVDSFSYLKVCYYLLLISRDPGGGAHIIHCVNDLSRQKKLVIL